MAKLTPTYRHAGFSRSRIVTRAIAAAAVALTGMFALVAAHAVPGRKTTTPSQPSAPTPAVDPFSSEGIDPNLAPPALPPSRGSVDAPLPQVVSGGS